VDEETSYGIKRGKKGKGKYPHSPEIKISREPIKPIEQNKCSTC
jgi:hypothetical protein